MGETRTLRCGWERREKRKTESVHGRHQTLTEKERSGKRGIKQRFHETEENLNALRERDEDSTLRMEREREKRETQSSADSP